MRSRGFATIVLDLRQLTFMDSTGLRLLLRLDAESRSDGFRFAIVDGEGPVRRLLELTQFDRQFRRADG
ncbi:MAG TPA: STAS domain-containing protein [Conexibacter sp.]|jgi:anti-sigma B factor antagonist|nr:STAS domain-containing protein [Conexibacter sp.]